MFKSKHSSKTKLRLPNETKPLYPIPSISQIAPLPEVASHGVLPVLSLDEHDIPKPMPLTHQLLPISDGTNHSTRHQSVGARLSAYDRHFAVRPLFDALGRLTNIDMHRRIRCY